MSIVFLRRKAAREYIDNYLATFTGVDSYLKNTVKDAREKGYTTTRFGRRRPIPELSSSNKNLQAFGERVAMNSPIQGTAADIIKIAMNQVRERLKKEKLESRLILQIHDELLIETKNEEVTIVTEILKEEMEHAVQLLVPLDVDVHVADNWYDAK